MTLAGSFRDAWLVARFEVLRAIRTWRALALIVLYLVATAGSAWIFVEFLHVLETAVAETLMVPVTDRPGAMLGELVKGDELRGVIAGMTGDEALVDDVLAWPVLAIFHLWFALLLTPFFAASTAAEAVSIDLSTRALRFEVLRTGRLELAVGRFLGQAALTGLASFVGVLGTWAVGMLGMVGNDPFELFGALCWLTLRAWVFALPFAGFGVAVSQATASPNWARVLAVAGTAGSWIAYGVALNYVLTPWGPLCDVVLQVVPQGHMRGLWQPVGWIGSGLVCGGLALAWVAVGYARFARRDL